MRAPQHSTQIDTGQILFSALNFGQTQKIRDISMTKRRIRLFILLFYN